MVSQWNNLLSLGHDQYCSVSILLMDGATKGLLGLLRCKSREMVVILVMNHNTFEILQDMVDEYVWYVKSSNH